MLNTKITCIFIWYGHNFTLSLHYQNKTNNKLKIKRNEKV